MDNPVRSPATKVTVYIVPSVGTVQRLASTRFAAGFYNAQVEGPIAVVPRRSGSGDYDLNPQTILFHEYAHHLFLSDLDHPIPLWLSEGCAEFFATVDFDSNRRGDARSRRNA